MQGQFQAQKPSNHRHVFINILIILVLAFSGLFFLYIPNTVAGSDNSLFTNGQLMLSEKITFIFRRPKIGDIVTFTSQSPSLDEIQHIGVIIDQKTDLAHTIYTIVNRKNPQRPWQVTADNINSLIYYPHSKLSSLPIIPVPTLTPTPTIIHTSMPAISPSTKVIRTTATPTMVVTSNQNNQPGCQIVARALNEGIPQEYNLAYSAFNLGAADNYVTGIQWDYDGNGNWDSDLSLTNGNVNYSYSTPGVHTIIMKIQVKSGTSYTCQTQIGVQPH